jgi:hypothetical protein
MGWAFRPAACLGDHLNVHLQPGLVHFQYHCTAFVSCVYSLPEMTKQNSKPRPAAAPVQLYDTGVGQSNANQPLQLPVTAQSLAI